MNFLPGTVNGGMLELGDGMAVPLPGLVKDIVKTGDKITFGIRPEHLEIGPAGMALMVDSAEALGSDSLIHGKMGVHGVVVRADGHLQNKHGERLTVTPMPDKYYFFDTASGRRI